VSRLQAIEQCLASIEQRLVGINESQDSTDALLESQNRMIEQLCKMNERAVVQQEKSNKVAMNMADALIQFGKRLSHLETRVYGEATPETLRPPPEAPEVQ
jgi:hypothetical protein